MRRFITFTLLGLAAVLALLFIEPTFLPHAIASAQALASATGLQLHLLAAGLAGKGVLMAAAPLVSKDRAANELRLMADAKQAELMDSTKSFTSDEVNTRAAEIAALRQRAAIAAKFTADDEIARQGGDEELKRLSPDNTDPDAPAVGLKERMEAMRKRAIKEFGSTDQMIRSLAREEVGSLRPSAQAFVKDLKELTRTIVGTASDASGGEFVLPLQQVAEIFRVPNVQESIFTKGRRYPVTGRTLRIPYLRQTLTAASGVTVMQMAGGFADVSIVGEGVTKPTKEPEFQQRLLTVYKWAAYAEIGDEVLADDLTGELAPSVTQSILEQTVNAMGERMTNGSGTAEPLGWLHANNAALLSVTRATGGTITVTDLFKMYSRHLTGPNSYWSCSRRVVEALFALTLGSNTLVSWLQSLRDKPVQPMLLGLPVVINDLQPSLGTGGDIALVNPDFYAIGVRAAVTVESSTHYRFANDVTAFRFFARAGGIPIPDGAFAYQVTGTTQKDPYSPFVTVAT
jgi:HK97 family phage major capsid protein